MEKQLKVDVTITVNDMFRFLLFHNYCRLSGIIGFVFGLACFVLGIIRYDATNTKFSVALLFIGFVFVVLQPAILYSKAKAQVKGNKALQGTLTYIFYEQGIDVCKEEQKATVLWSDIYKVVGLKTIILIYTNPVHANVISKRQLGDDAKHIMEYAREHLSRHQVKGK